MFENTLDSEMWTDAITAKYDGKGEFTKENWDGLLGHCMAVTDIPCAVRTTNKVRLYYPLTVSGLRTRNHCSLP